MGILSFLLGRAGIGDKILKALISALDEMVREAERIYRRRLDLLRSEGVNAPLTGQGLLKARLLGSSYLVLAFAVKCADSDELCIGRFMEVATGIAFMPFAEDDSYPRLRREDALAFSGDFLMSALRAIAKELKEGPSFPFRQTSGFRELVDLYHQAVCDSVGSDTYRRNSESYGSTPAERLDHFITSEILAGLRHMTQWMSDLAPHGATLRSAVQKLGVAQKPLA